MKKLGAGMVTALGWLLLGQAAQAVPGQTIDEATAWIQANSTLRPTAGEKLLVRKSDTPAQRFSFQASVLQVGKAAPSNDRSGGIIRTESFTLFDMINGVTQPRLEESLRAIYGPAIYQDYSRAQAIYTYPSRSDLAQAQNQKAPLMAALQGELRSGDRYAYWVEIAQTKEGYAYSGQITVFLKQDIDKLEAELRNR